MFITKTKTGYLVTIPKDFIRDIPPDDEHPDGKELVLMTQNVLNTALMSHIQNLKGIKSVLSCKKLVGKIANMPEKTRQVELTSDELSMIKDALNSVSFTPVVFEWADFLTFLEELEEA